MSLANGAEGFVFVLVLDNTWLGTVSRSTLQHSLPLCLRPYCSHPISTTMHPAVSKSYIVPAIFLNPVLFLMSINTILSRCLPPIVIDAAKQPPPYFTFGPSAQHPHLNVHASEKLCWSYTFLIVCVQLAAFGRVSECREAGKVKARSKANRNQAKAGARKGIMNTVCMNGHSHADGAVERGSEKHEDQENGFPGLDSKLWHLEASDEESTKTSDSETVH